MVNLLDKLSPRRHTDHRGRTEIFKLGYYGLVYQINRFAAFVLIQFNRGQATRPNPEIPIFESSALPQSRREVVTTALFLKCEAGKVYGTGYRWASQN